jgi:hypothetical protein
MKTATVIAKSKKEAEQKCLNDHGFFPDAVRRVDSGSRAKAWICFEGTRDAETWDKQK